MSNSKDKKTGPFKVEVRNNFNYKHLAPKFFTENGAHFTFSHAEGGISFEFWENSLHPHVRIYVWNKGELKRLIYQGRFWDTPTSPSIVPDGVTLNSMTHPGTISDEEAMHNEEALQAEYEAQGVQIEFEHSSPLEFTSLSDAGAVQRIDQPDIGESNRRQSEFLGRYETRPAGRR